jgi:hypothetical protein
MNEHESIRELLLLAAAGALDGPGELRRVTEHAATCEVCRRELQVWSVYTEGLGRLPQPLLPAGLMERTRARIVEQRAAAARRRENALLLGALSLFGWISTLAFWTLARVFTGGVWNLFGVNLVSALTWSLLSTVVVWITAGASAVMLGDRREVRRVL